MKDSSPKMRLNAFRSLATYEAINKGAGLVKWKGNKTALGYRLCYYPSKKDENEYCVDTGPVTSYRLSDMKRHGKGIDGLHVQAYIESGFRDEDIKFIDIRTLLQKSMETEMDIGVRTQKEKAMLKMVEAILKDKTKAEPEAEEK
jgi:hypothetical protein